jgi:N-acetylmuramoyl-L-alanine amidase
MFNKHSLTSYIFYSLLAFGLTQCGTTVHYVTPVDLQTVEGRDSTISSFSRYLKDKTIFLDPGHGGDDRSGKGPAGDVVEADLNLEVTLRLRDFLIQAGANVIVSRETDVSIPVLSRIEQANVNNADLFVSVHHNAAANDYVNYTTTFYHAREGDAEYQPSSHDLARYIQRDLSFAIDNPGPLASFDGTMSDYLIYPRKGFAVLRNASMTSVLVECAFFSSAYEEQRLSDPVFNEIEAWGIFRGIGKYFRSGIPILAYHGETVFNETLPSFDLTASDFAGIDDESISVRIDGTDQGFLFDKKNGAITVKTLYELSPGYHKLTAQVRNNNGNSSFPFSVYFAIGSAPATLKTNIHPPEIPADYRAFSYVIIEAVDSLDQPCIDGLPLRFQTSLGTDTVLQLKNGRALAYIEPGDASEVTFTASNGPVVTNGRIRVVPNTPYSRGIIMSSDGKPIAGAAVSLPDGNTIHSNPNGEYVIHGRRAEGLEVTVKANGYFGTREAFNKQLVQDPIVMNPVAKGILREKVVFIELIGSNGIPIPIPLESLQIDLQVFKTLEQLLAASGANVINLSALPKDDRTALLIRYNGAPMVQLCNDAGTRRTWFRRGGSNSSRNFTDAIIRGIDATSSLEVRTWPSRIHHSNEVSGMNQTAIYIPSSGRKTYPEQQLPFVAQNIAWGIYQGILNSLGYKQRGTKKVEVSVIQKSDGSPAAFVEVVLNKALRAMTNENGKVTFKAVSIDEDDVLPAEEDKYIISGVKTEILN